MDKKHETCKHAIRSGQMAVYVTPGCPQASMIKGVLVSSKERCRKCKNWERKQNNKVSQRAFEKFKGLLEEGDK